MKSWLKKRPWLNHAKFIKYGEMNKKKKKKRGNNEDIFKCKKGETKWEMVMNKNCKIWKKSQETGVNVMLL